MTNIAVEPPIKTLDVFKTARFTFVAPTGRKRAALRHAMRHAHISFGRLLEAYMPDDKEVERLQALPKRERTQHLSALLSTIEKATTPLHQLAAGAKAAISREVVAAISSHIELKAVQEHAGVPTAAHLKETSPEHDAALLALRDAIDLATETALRDELLRRARSGRLRPLYFHRVTFSRGFLLLRNEATGHLYAWLNLFPADSRYAKPVAVDNMTNLQTGELVSFKSKTGMLFPLELGHAYQLKTFIDRDDGQRPTPQSARLVYVADEDRFELHVAFQWKSAAIATERWLGVDRGIYNLAALAVVDADGRVLAEANIDGRVLREMQRKRERAIAKDQHKGRVMRDKKRRAWADHAVHNAANQIVAFALQHKARVIIEDLSNLSAMGKKPRVVGRRRGGFNKLLGRKQYEKLAAVLGYKLKAVGLPDPRPLDPRGTSQTCPECGHWSSDNRVKVPNADGFEMAEFKCVACGHTADADANAARIIGMKGAWFFGLPKNAKRGSDGKLADALRFDAFIKAAAERRRSQRLV